MPKTNHVVTANVSEQPVKFVDVGHSQIAYCVTGTGTPLLFIHGYPLSGLTYRNIAPHFADQFTCYLPDLPGLGETQWSPETDFNFKAQAQTLKAFIDQLGLKSYAVVAHDTGATIARCLALIDAERMTKLVMMGTEIPDHRPPWIQLFQKVCSPHSTFLFRTLLRSKAFRRSTVGFGACFHNPSLVEGEFLSLFIKPLMTSPYRASGAIHYLQGIDWQVIDDLKIEHRNITIPTLLIWGENDSIFPVKLARAMVDQLANCKGFMTVPNAKIFVHEECPEAVAEICKDFLNQDFL